jgi:hypothetical protein
VPAAAFKEPTINSVHPELVEGFFSEIQERFDKLNANGGLIRAWKNKRAYQFNGNACHKCA